MRISDVSRAMGTRKGAINLVKAIAYTFNDKWNDRPIGKHAYETGTRSSMLMCSEDKNTPFEIVEFRERNISAKSRKCCGVDVQVSLDGDDGYVLIKNTAPILIMNIKFDEWSIRYNDEGKEHLLKIIDKLSHWTNACSHFLIFKHEPDSYELITNYIKDRSPSESIRHESLSEIDEDRMIELVAECDNGMMHLTLTDVPIPIRGRVYKPKVKVDSNHWIFNSTH